jgi:hypothetical protein
VSARLASRLGWWSLAASAGLIVAANVLAATTPSARISSTDRFNLLGVLFSIAYLMFSVVGALIVSRQPGNGVGRLFCVGGFVSALWLFTIGYTLRAVPGGASWLPAGRAVAWLDNVVSVPAVWLFPAVFFLFPSGRSLTPRWRALLWVGGVGVGVGTLAAALRPGRVEQIDSQVDNPLGVASLHEPIAAVDAVLGILLALLAAAGVASLVLRFRRGDRLERLQLKWFAYAAGFALSLLVMLAVQRIARFGENGLADRVASTLLFAAIVAIPLAVGVAILRHRLYDIDVVINRTLVYGALTATLAGAYLGSVLLFQLALRPLTSQSNLAIAGSTLAVAALFRPARSRIQAAVDRRFYRRKYDAGRTLEAFSARLREEVDLDALNAELRTVVHETMQPSHVSLWLRATESGR